MKRKLTMLVSENLSYKLISLFIALILWITILGRSDSISTRQVEVEVITAPHVIVASQSADKIKIRVSGPRTALRRFVENGLSQVVTLDLSGKSEGLFQIQIPREKVDLPFGVRLISISPEILDIKLEKRQ